MGERYVSMVLAHPERHFAVMCDDDGTLNAHPVEAWVLREDGCVSGADVGPSGVYLVEDYGNFLGYCGHEELPDVEAYFAHERDSYMRRLRRREEQKDAS